MKEIRKSEFFMDSSTAREFAMLDDGKTIRAEYLRWEPMRGYRRVNHCDEVACFIAPLEFLPVFYRQLNETLIGWRGYSWDKVKEYPYGNYLKGMDKNDS